MECDAIDERGTEALAGLLRHLHARDYRFVTPTPASHARVLARPEASIARDLRDVFGWSMPFPSDLLDRDLLHRLRAAGLVEEAGESLKSRVRVSSLGADLFVHSAFPTDDTDAVFFGPDSYRFADLISRELARCPQRPGATLVDIGTGAGVGAIVAARLCPEVAIVMTDINPAALALARINAQAAGVPASFHCAADLSPIAGPLDLVLANPPYIIDSAGRTYRDGGDMHGGQISVEMAERATPRLAPGGRFILYTGSAIVRGRDALQDRLASLAREHGCILRYAEIDPDVFGEELETPAYRDVERIALVSAVIERAGQAA
ncbi:methyltransferase [Sphingomonas aracearum]|uniref:Methyltransferase domain-containing protein n=1 Tax=Sphingomonas aracearum TaxID=2283317 RepID=A0A369VTL8_9SPHN|nr:methyltransferase [Sphingomonas aracearum]RDE04995.1 methyltransferase domain-containing protein [Sphingomonas aracearum]